MTSLIGCRSSNSSDSFKDTESSKVMVYDNNPPAEGFDIEGSSPVGILLADQVMHSMGGRKQWDKTNVLYWNFLGLRTLLWDKENNRVRIDIPGENVVMALDMNTMTGNVWKEGKPILQADSLKKQLDRAREIWINDSYWLVMPFKLKDTGVTITYIGEGLTQDSIRSDIIRLTFDNVGVTPQNAYEVWVDIDDKLIKQWAYFKEATQFEPSFVLPWTNYKDYDGLLLSGERGDRDLTDIKVLKHAPKEAFNNPEPLKL